MQFHISAIKYKIFLYSSIYLVLFIFSCTEVSNSFAVRQKKTSYYPNGQIERTYHIRHTRTDSLLEGTFIQYYPDGKLKFTATYKNGQLEGTAKEYHLEEGNPVKSIHHYRSGIPVDTFQHYYPNGKLMQTGKFENGRTEGKVVSYYKTGELLTQSNWHKDVQQLEAVSYYKEGQPKVYSFYNRSGNRTFQVNYLPTGKTEWTGHPIAELEVNRRIWRQKKLLHLDVFIAKPESYTTQLIISRKQTTKTEDRLTPITKTPYHFIIEEPLPPDRTFQYIIEVKMTDEQGQITTFQKSVWVETTPEVTIWYKF